MMIHDGKEYATIVQDEQTYAIPSEYQSMQLSENIIQVNYH